MPLLLIVDPADWDVLLPPILSTFVTILDLDEVFERQMFSFVPRRTVCQPRRGTVVAPLEASLCFDASCLGTLAADILRGFLAVSKREGIKSNVLPWENAEFDFSAFGKNLVFRSALPFPFFPVSVPIIEGCVDERNTFAKVTTLTTKNCEKRENVMGNDGEAFDIAEFGVKQLSLSFFIEGRNADKSVSSANWNLKEALEECRSLVAPEIQNLGPDSSLSLSLEEDAYFSPNDTVMPFELQDISLPIYESACESKRERNISRSARSSFKRLIWGRAEVLQVASKIEACESDLIASGIDDMSWNGLRQLAVCSSSAVDHASFFSWSCLPPTLISKESMPTDSWLTSDAFLPDLKSIVLSSDSMKAPWRRRYQFFSEVCPEATKKKTAHLFSLYLKRVAEKANSSLLNFSSTLLGECRKVLSKPPGNHLETGALFGLKGVNFNFDFEDVKHLKELDPFGKTKVFERGFNPRKSQPRSSTEGVPSHDLNASALDEEETKMELESNAAGGSDKEILQTEPAGSFFDDGTDIGSGESFFDKNVDGSFGGLDKFMSIKFAAAAGLGVQTGRKSSPAADMMNATRGNQLPTKRKSPAAAPPSKKPQPRCLSLPPKFPLASIHLSLAKLCLATSRCVVLLPPPLSILPTMIALASSYLQDGKDHRVLFLCPGLSTDDVGFVSHYASSVFSDTFRVFSTLDVSTETKGSHVVISDTTERMKAAKLSTARFSCVFVLFSAVCKDIRATLPESLRFMSSQQKQGVSLLPSTVLFAPFPAFAGTIQATTEVIEFAEKSWNLKQVVVCCGIRDLKARECIEIARPSEFYIVLPAIAQASVTILEEIAFPFLRAHFGRESNIPPSLVSLDITELHSEMKRARGGAATAPAELNQLVVINILKRALTFTITESVKSAKEFIALAAMKYPNSVLGECVSRLAFAIASESSGGKGADVNHCVDYVEALLAKERNKMGEECASIRSRRIAKNWNPLIIAESPRAADRLLSLVKNSIDVQGFKYEGGKTKPDCVFVAHSSQLDNASKSHWAAIEFFSKFSHIIYLSSMGPGQTEAQIPVHQLSHACSLRLIYVSVDPTKRMERTIRRESVAFNKLCLALPNQSGKTPASPTRAIDSEIILSAISKVDSHHGKLRPESEGKSNEPLPWKVEIGVGVLARHSVESIASLLFSKLRDAKQSSPKNTHGLELVVDVPPRVSTYMSCLSLFEAIASYQCLVENVAVSFRLHAKSLEEDDKVFRPGTEKKRKTTI